MRSSVSVILSTPTPDTSMSHPDYDQTAHDHAALLVLVRHIGSQLKPKQFTRVFERVSRVCQERVEDSSGVVHMVAARYIREYPVENNDWGDFQTHRRLLGLVTVGKYDSQQELNELCRIHESLKVKYSSTLFDSRCVLLGYEDPSPFSPPSNFKTAEALWYADGETCTGLESQLSAFLRAVFWVLESKRLERGREKIERVALLQAPFEKKDFVGLDLESRVNRKRCVGRMTKHLGDLSLQSGLYAEALAYYTSAAEVLRGVNDWLWLGGALEGLCAASVVVLHPSLGRASPLQRNASLQEGSPIKQRATSISTGSLPSGVAPPDPQEPPPHLLNSDEVLKRYREAVIHYSKYQNAGIVETEASFKAARIAVEQSCTLQAASFLQNVIFISLPLSEHEKIQRFTSLSELYAQIGFQRKASFCRRLAATRHVSSQNPQPNWSHCYQLMLQSLPGHRLSLDPGELPLEGAAGWPALQVQLLQELVVAAKRAGLPALATRHMTFLLQSMWAQLSPPERRDLALQLQALAAQCEGAPVPLVLDSGQVVPPANLTSVPVLRSFSLQTLAAALRPQRLQSQQEDSGPFLFTPIHFGSLERRGGSSNKLDCQWVVGDTCEVALELGNPLPFELRVTDMRLLTSGAVCDSLPVSVVLPPDCAPRPVALAAIPKEAGKMEVLGFSTHTLGVKSNVRLRQLRGFPYAPLQVEVMPALPRLAVTATPPTGITVPAATPSCLAAAAHVVASVSLALYSGQSAEVAVQLRNIGQQPVEVLEASVTSALESELQGQVFQWSSENLQAQLPLPANGTASLTLYLHCVADFLAPGPPDTELSSLPTSSLPANSQPTSFLSGPSSLPSRLSSPAPLGRRHDLTASFRSESSSRSGSSLGSCRFPASKVGSPSIPKALEAQLKLRYSGGPGLAAGQCRLCAVSVALELLPSVLITSWDVLPAETSSQFYLVLDVANVSTHELELQYAPGKSVLMEGGESCRVPVPVTRCPLAKLTKLYEGGPLTTEERRALDAVCSEHVVAHTDLRWHMPGPGLQGRVSLRGLSLTPDMLDVVRMSPVHWEVTVDGQPVRAQEEVAARAGQPLVLGVTVANALERPLSQLLLALQFYQDHQNGAINYRLDTRLATAGTPRVLLPQLAEQGSAYHECSVVFFTPGQYKADIQCSAQAAAMAAPPRPDDHTAAAAVVAGHTWKFIPPVCIAVQE